ncbi:hypothetical protein GAO09_19525 [Rhizobiales bacterium RZME27]|uniref:Uncharacterized protein n=1 Tax=Endobacterium cereale TaxID=2663029 RepID=A0A6A8AE87_9HYPH|nr:hypothetical protein [Endobacterium cereale]MQY48228.1 hypothetical protein [Endobacterium cereale]
MNTIEIYRAAAAARAMSKELDVALAFADAGMTKHAETRVCMALAALPMLAHEIGYRVEKVSPDTASSPRTDVPMFKPCAGLSDAGVPV